MFEDSNERYDILILTLLRIFHLCLWSKLFRFHYPHPIMSLVTISNELDDCGTDLATDIMVGYCLETVPELAESSSITLRVGSPTRKRGRTNDPSVVPSLTRRASNRDPDGRKYSRPRGCPHSRYNERCRPANEGFSSTDNRL